MHLILHNIRSVYNVGAIFRTAEAAGVSKIYLTGYTPTPLDRFGRARKDLHKAALGAEELVLWEHEEDITKAIQETRSTGHEVVAIEQSKGSIDYREYKPKKEIALILGNEVGGVPEEILLECDAILEIPMKGKKESLNVSVAAGIVIYQLDGSLTISPE